MTEGPCLPTPLVRRPPYEVQTETRPRPVNVKAAMIVECGFKNLRSRPRPSRRVRTVLRGVRKPIGWGWSARIFRWNKATSSCSTRFAANGAYMVMAALAWTLTAWFALRMPETAGGRPATPRRRPRGSRWTSKRFSTPLCSFPCTSCARVVASCSACSPGIGGKRSSSASRRFHIRAGHGGWFQAGERSTT